MKTVGPLLKVCWIFSVCAPPPSLVGAYYMHPPKRTYVCSIGQNIERCARNLLEKTFCLRTLPDKVAEIRKVPKYRGLFFVEFLEKHGSVIIVGVESILK